MIGEILSLIPSIIGLFNSNKSHDQYTDELNKIKDQQKLSQSALQAKSLLAENATRGMAGYETAKEDINNELPTTMNQAKDFLTGGGAVDYLAKASASRDKQLRDLGTENEAAKEKNMNIYASFLGGPMAGYENQLQEDKSQLGVAAGYNKADKAATENQYMFGMGNSLAKMSDKDLAALIAALFGKNDNKLDLTTGKDYGIASGATL